MKFIINNRDLSIHYEKDDKVPYSGSIKDYLIDIEFSEEWNGLSKVAKICIDGENEGKERAVINDKVYIDMDEHNDRYAIGFIGYTVENNVKVYQKSTNLKIIPYPMGAGEIKTTEDKVPTASQWEIYIAQIQEMIDNIEDVHLSNAYLDGSTLVLELNNGNALRVELGGITPPVPTTDIRLVTSNNEVFITNDNKNFIVKES